MMTPSAGRLQGHRRLCFSDQKIGVIGSCMMNCSALASTLLHLEGLSRLPLCVQCSFFKNVDSRFQPPM